MRYCNHKPPSSEVIIGHSCGYARADKYETVLAIFGDGQARNNETVLTVYGGGLSHEG